MTMALTPLILQLGRLNDVIFDFSTIIGFWVKGKGYNIIGNQWRENRHYSRKASVIFGRQFQTELAERTKQNPPRTAQYKFRIWCTPSWTDSHNEGDHFYNKYLSLGLSVSFSRHENFQTVDPQLEKVHLSSCVKLVKLCHNKLTWWCLVHHILKSNWWNNYSGFVIYQTDRAQKLYRITNFKKFRLIDPTGVKVRFSTYLKFA